MAVNTSFLKRLVKEDFSKQDQDLVGKIAFVLNPALQQITNILSHGLAIADLNTQVKDLTVTVDADGFPTTNLTFTSTLAGKCSMIQIGRAQPTTATNVYPTGGHSVSFIDNSGQITISNITGLPANIRFTIRIIAYV